MSPRPRTMSLRRRFVTVLLVACVALGTALAAAMTLSGQEAASREAAARELGRRAIDELARDDATPEGRAVKERLAAAIVPLRDGTVGYCARDGRILREATAVDTSGATFPFRASPGRSAMLPLDRDAVVEACKRATEDATTTRFGAPHTALFVTVRALRAGEAAAFVLVRMPLPHERASFVWTFAIAVSAVAGLALLGLTSHALIMLRRSTEALEASLVDLEGDLRAEICAPGTVELDRVAERLGRLVSRLADAQERERALTVRVEEQRRLASLGRVVAGVAHEVRNPLAGLKLRLDGMALRPLDERSSVDVTRCLREVDRLDRLVRSLLLISRRPATERAPFDAASLVDERIALAEAAAQGRDVRLVRDGEGSLEANREEIARLLDNLVRNAVEASPAGATVTVRLRSDAKSMTITVIDEGAGVPEARLAELFEPFFTTKGGGTGLGLVLSRSVAEAHGGTLRYARSGPATHFTLELPRTTTGGTE